MKTDGTSGILSGLTVLEIGHFVAAPFCTRLLGDLGADVIKVEPFAGDPVRQWGKQKNGTTAWWSVHGRNKRLISVDLKKPQAIDLIKDLASKSDVLVENFRPGHLDRLGLGQATLKGKNPELIIARISGFGQDGPYRDRAAFGVIGEAVGGLRHLCNHPPGTTNLPPVRVGVSVGDSLAGLYAAFGIVTALWQKAKGNDNPRYQLIDVALTESVLSFMEGLLPEYALFGTSRQPDGSRIPTAAPSSAYPTNDGQWIIIAANSDPLFKSLCALIERPELAQDPRFVGNASRVKNVEAIDEIIAAWSSRFAARDLDLKLAEANIPATLSYTAAECAEDPQFLARGMVRRIDDPILGEILHPGIVPHFPQAPGSIRWPGALPGAHTSEVLAELLGYTDTRIQELRNAEVIR